MLRCEHSFGNRASFHARTRVEGIERLVSMCDAVLATMGDMKGVEHAIVERQAFGAVPDVCASESGQRPRALVVEMTIGWNRQRSVERHGDRRVVAAPRECHQRVTLVRGGNPLPERDPTHKVAPKRSLSGRISLLNALLQLCDSWALNWGVVNCLRLTADAVRPQEK